MGFIGKALGVVAKAVGLDSVGAAVDTIKNAIAGNPEAAKAIREFELEEKRLLLEELRTTHRLYIEEIKSEDPFVRRVRPACVWVVVGILAMNYILVPFVNIIIVAFGGAAVKLVFPEIPAEVLALFGTLFGLYGGYRSIDKRTKAKNGGR